MRRERILVVEDENIVAMDIQNGLQQAGYDVPERVDNGDEAIKKAFELKPDLVLMDIQIKGSRDGIETAREIWSKLRIPVIFLTAYADEKTLDRAKETDPFGYILKPFEERELHTAIEVALSKHRRIQQERSKHLTALAQSEKRFEMMVESVKDYAIFMLDPEGNVTSWNVGAEKINGYSVDEVLGKNFCIFYPDEAFKAGRPQIALELAKERGRYEDEGWRVRKNGSRFWANVVLSSIRDENGRLLGFGKVARDLTERKKMEDRSRFLSEVSSVLSYSLDLDITLREMANLVVQEFAAFCAVDVMDDDGHLQRIAFASRHPQSSELGIRLAPLDRNSAQMSGSLMSVPLVTRDRVLGVITFKSDSQMDDYRPTDLEVAKELASRAAHAVENAKLYLEAQAAIRTRDEFLSIASHELKTPLTTLRLQAQITKRGLRKGDMSFFTSERLNRLVDQVDAQVDRLAHLVDDMLDVSKARIGKLSANLEEINLSEVVRDVTSSMSQQLNEVGCELKLHLQHRVIGFWDKYRMEQVLLNLLSNALKYGAGKPIEVTVSSHHDVAQIKVKDNGIGIAKADQERIFRRFERAISASEVSGLGLGLYITYEILKAHEGTIRVVSEREKGSEFIVELPLHPRRSRELQTPG